MFHVKHIQNACDWKPGDAAYGPLADGCFFLLYLNSIDPFRRSRNTVRSENRIPDLLLPCRQLDGLEQLLLPERLGKCRCGAKLFRDLQEVQFAATAAARDGDDFQVRLKLSHLPNDADAFFVGHDDIGNHQIGMKSGKLGQSLTSIGGLGDFISRFFQNRGNHRPHRWFIIYDKRLHEIPVYAVAEISIFSSVMCKINIVLRKLSHDQIAPHVQQCRAKIKLSLLTAFKTIRMQAHNSPTLTGRAAKQIWLSAISRCGTPS